MFKIDDSTSVMVRGPTVYKVTNGYVSTSLGTIANDGRPVTIGWNGTNVVIASDGSLYSLTLSGSSSTLLLSGIGSVDVLGDFFVATEVGSNNFVWSDANSVTFDPSEHSTYKLCRRPIGRCEGGQESGLLLWNKVC